MKCVDENGEEIDLYFNIYQPFDLGLTQMLKDEIELPKKQKNKKGKQAKTE